MAHIIIADDDEIIGELVREALLAGGHGVGVVTNGSEALRAVKARRPDLLILDCNMPELSGVLVLREVRNTPELSNLPIMMLTGRRSREDRDLALYAGADAYVKKPIDPDELVFRIEDLLATRRKNMALSPR